MNPGNRETPPALAHPHLLSTGIPSVIPVWIRKKLLELVQGPVWGCHRHRKMGKVGIFSSLLLLLLAFKTNSIENQFALSESPASGWLTK